MQSVGSGRRVDSVRSLLVFVILTLVCGSPIAFAATKMVTDADKGSDVELKVGDVLEVRLKSNPSAGYMWYVHPKSTGLLRLMGESQVQDTEAGGDRPRAQVFRFETKRRGDGILLLRHVRAGEKPELGEEQFTLHLVSE